MFLKRVLRRCLQGFSVKIRFLEGFLEGNVHRKYLKCTSKAEILSQSMTPFACTLCSQLQAACLQLTVFVYNCFGEFFAYLGLFVYDGLFCLTCLGGNVGPSPQKNTNPPLSSNCSLSSEDRGSLSLRY